MTPSELAVLRDKVARARLCLANPVPVEVDTQRRLWREQARRWRGARRYRCVYCGERLRDKRGRYWKRAGLACVKHADLPFLDPRYSRLELHRRAA